MSSDGAPATSRTGMPQSCWVTWQAACSTSTSHEAALAATLSTPSAPASTRDRVSSAPVPGALDDDLGR